MRSDKLLESTQRALQNRLTESNNLYYCKVVETSTGYYKHKFVYYLGYKDNNVTFEYNIEDGTILTKAKWNTILDNANLQGRLNGDYKVSFIKASEETNLIRVYYIPHRDWQGTWNLNQFKYELKKSEIPVINIEQDMQYHRYGDAEKYYIFYIPESYRNEIEQFINIGKNMCDVSLQPPQY